MMMMMMMTTTTTTTTTTTAAAATAMIKTTQSNYRTGQDLRAPGAIKTPRFQANRHMMVVKVVCPTHRPPGTHFC
jgi:hypothetical protein